MSFSLGNILGLVSAASSGVPIIATNKKRAAVVGHEGFRFYDVYASNRGGVFVVSGSLCVLFACVGYYRRHHGAEAIALWGSLSAMFAGITYLSRPVTVSDGNGNVQNAPGALESIEMYLDKRAAELDIAEPGWDDKVVARILPA